MIVRPGMHWFRILWVWRGSVLPRIMPRVLLTTSFALLVLLTHGDLWNVHVSLTAEPFTLIGVALSIFLAFRNNVSYARFWDARVEWGRLLNQGRNLTRQALTHYSGPRAEAEQFALAFVACVHALRHQLRGTDADGDVLPLLPASAHDRVRQAAFKPTVIVLVLGEWLQTARRDGHLSDILAQSMDKQLSETIAVIGACERIAGTPIPFTYSVLLHRTVYLFCFLLPFGLINQIGYMTPVIVAFVSYTFFALDAISDEIEEPFGTMPNDLALEAMGQMIESTVRELLGQQPLPQPELKDGYLLL